MEKNLITVLEVITSEEDIQELYGKRDPVTNAELQAAEETVNKSESILQTAQDEVAKAHENYTEALEKLQKLRNRSNRKFEDVYNDPHPTGHYAHPRHVGEFRDRVEYSRYSCYRNGRNADPVFQKFISIFEELRNEESTVFLRANLDYNTVQDILDDLSAFPLASGTGIKAILDCDNCLFIVIPTSEEPVIFHTHFDTGIVSISASGSYQRLTNQHVSSVRVLENSLRICA